MSTRQAGMSSLTLLTVLIAAAFALLVIFRVGPLYLDNYFVRSSVNALQNEDVRNMSNHQIYSALGRYFMVNGVRDISARDAEIERNNSNTVVTLRYEKRAHFIANLDVVVTFTNQFDSADY